MRETAVIIAGGGTGGHLYPALVLGRKLVEKIPSLSLTFVGGRRETERSIMAGQGVRFVSMRIEGLKGRGLKSLKSIAMLPGAFIKSLGLLIRARPALVVGVGGYSSGPVVILASVMRIPTVILEPNVLPGFTTRLLLPWVRKAVAAFEVTLPHLKGKGIFLGNPVREEFESLPPKKRTDRLAILIFGGSQGSHFLNLGVTASLSHLKDLKGRLGLTHQTGEKDFEMVKALYIEAGFGDAVVAPYFFDMPGRFLEADLVVCRAGATTCAELIAARKASILVPFAGAAENHQAANAAALAGPGGADVILECEWTPRLFAEKIAAYLNHPERIDAMEKSLAGLRSERTADRIAGLCLELMKAHP